MRNPSDSHNSRKDVGCGRLCKQNRNVSATRADGDASQRCLFGVQAIAQDDFDVFLRDFETRHILNQPFLKQEDAAEARI